MKRAALLTLFAACASSPPKAADAPPQRNPEQENRSAGLYEAPHAPYPNPDAPFRQEPPRPGPPIDFHPPVPKELRLSNGLHVYVIERHEVPLATLSLAIRSGADTDPPGRAGLASLALDMMDEGTAGKDAAAIASGFEDLGARYITISDADASGISVTALSDTLQPVLELFSEVALRPAFRAADLERVRTERLGAIAQALDDPQSVGQHVLSRIIYGSKHPWGYPTEGTVRTVKSITRAEVVAWHRANFRPSNAALFIAGDVDAATLQPLLEAKFGSWKETQGSPSPQRNLPKAASRVVTLVDKPDAPQSQIWIGELGVASTAPDIFPVRVMNNILGEAFNSRLNANLRSEHAYSYGVGSFFETHREAGPFVAAGGVVSDKTADALAEFMRELTRMQTGEVSEAELHDAKESLARAIPALFASDEQTAGAFARAWAHGLPLDYYARYAERVSAVTRADVARAARERLHPDRMAIVVVGPEKQIEEKIAALHLGKIEVRDAEGEARAAAAAASGASR